MFSLTLLLVMPSFWACHAGLENHKFKTWKGYKLLNGTRIKEISFINMSIARCASFCIGVCESATFSRTLNQCVTFTDRVYDSSIKRTSDPQWYTIYKNKPVQVNNWTLVFRAQRDINQSLYDLWTSTGTSDDNPLSVDFPVECLQLTYSNTCKRHFRSFILDQWVNIDMVKFSLYTNGMEVQYILFDGKKSKWTTWFEQFSILNSSWGNITKGSEIASFSIKGFDDGTSKRRFSINRALRGCHLDAAYVFAIDAFSDLCASSWSMTISSFPKLIYSPLDTMAKMGDTPTAYRYADVMAIFATFVST